MITKELAVSLRPGTILHHTSLKNADGTPSRFRVYGKCQTWKTRPNQFRLPTKHGLKTHIQITETIADQFVVAS